MWAGPRPGGYQRRPWCILMNRPPPSRSPYLFFFWFFVLHVANPQQNPRSPIALAPRTPVKLADDSTEPCPKSLALGRGHHLSRPSATRDRRCTTGHDPGTKGNQRRRRFCRGQREQEGGCKRDHYSHGCFFWQHHGQQWHHHNTTKPRRTTSRSGGCAKGYARKPGDGV